MKGIEKMKIDLPIGIRATPEEFNESYTGEFLRRYGYNTCRRVVTLMGTIYTETVQTKNGEEIVSSSDVLTYVGNKHWSVEHHD